MNSIFNVKPDDFAGGLRQQRMDARKMAGDVADIESKAGTNALNAQKTRADIANTQSQTALHGMQADYYQGQNALRNTQDLMLKRNEFKDRMQGPALALQADYDAYKKANKNATDEQANAFMQDKWKTLRDSNNKEFASLFGKEMPERFNIQDVQAWTGKVQGKVEEKRTAAETKTTNKTTKLSINEVSDADAAILQKAVEEGRLDPSKLNSRTAPIMAKVLKGNKNLDFNNATSTAAALKKMETQRSMVESFEKTASKNFDMIEQMYDKLPGDKSVYILNKLRMKWDFDFSGDPQLVPLARAMKTALTEYAKVITGQTGGAAVSDSARKEVETLLSAADRPETFKASLAAHRQEMKNRMGAFQDTIDSLKGGRGANVRGKEGAAEPEKKGTKKQVGRFTIEVE